MLCAIERADGRVGFVYDPGIAVNFHAAPPADVNLRAFWSGVPGPVLVIRGEHSDLLLTLSQIVREERGIW